MTDQTQLPYGSRCETCVLAREVDKRVDQFERSGREEGYPGERQDTYQLNHVAASCSGTGCELAAYIAVEGYLQTRATRSLAQEAADRAGSAANRTYTHHSPGGDFSS